MKLAAFLQRMTGPCTEHCKTSNSNAWISVSTPNPICNDYSQELNSSFKVPCKEKRLRELMKSQGNQEGSIVTRVLFLVPLNFLKGGHTFLLEKWTPKTVLKIPLLQMGFQPRLGIEGTGDEPCSSYLPRWPFRTASAKEWIWRIKATFQLNLIHLQGSLVSRVCSDWWDFSWGYTDDTSETGN